MTVAQARTAVLVFLLGATACTTAPTTEAQTNQIRNQQETMDSQQQTIDQLKEERVALDRRLKELEAKVAKAGSTHEAVEAAKGEMSESVRRVLERFKGDNQIEVIQEGKGYRFVLRESVLFSTGSADLSEEGKRALGRVADALRGGNQRVNVEGHTDDIPVTKDETKKKYPRGNIELSVGRAFAVYDYMIKDGNIEEGRMSVAGFGSHRPVAANTSEVGRWKNRRVEIRIEER